MLKMQLSDRIGSRIKLRDIHALMAIVETGSMSKAALLLNTGHTPSACSRSRIDREIAGW
jgi:hypothetical protein